MDGNTFQAELLVDGLEFVDALIDHGSNSYAIVNKSFSQIHDLACFQIPPRSLRGVTGLAGTVDQVCHFSIDLDGHKQSNVFAYVVEHAQHPIILGLPWIRDQDVVYDPQIDSLDIRSTQTHVSRSTTQREQKYSIKATSPSAMQACIRQAKKGKEITVFAASMRDIEKALVSKKELSPEEIRKRLPKEYAEYWDAFAHDKEDIPPLRGAMDCAIDLTKDSNGNEAIAPWGPLYSMSREELLVLRKTLTELLSKGFIKVSHSAAAAPVLFAKKPGGGLRFCVDYRSLNAITVKDRYPLPLIQETLRQVGQAKWYTKLDVRAAFHRLRVRLADTWKTAFRTRYGLFEWNVMPFGLANGPAAFQRFINWTLRDVLDRWASAYVDDILVYTDGSLQDHRAKVCDILRRLQEAGLRLDLDKCEFDVKRVKYLGMILDVEKGISMDPEKITAVRDWPAPSTVKGVRGFIGFANYYRDFIQDFSTLAMPLTALTKKDVPFKWTEECDQAFNTMKRAFLSGPALANFDPEAETRLECDASGFAIGGVLSQLHATEIGKFWRPVGFFSRKMTPAETNYSIHDKELLSIVVGADRWRGELRSLEKFEIITDHKNLEYFTRKQILSERQVRWMEQLESLPPWKAIHRAGSLSQVPDALSRRDEYDDHQERHGSREAILWKTKWNDNPIISMPAAVNMQPDASLLDQTFRLDDDDLDQVLRNAATQPSYQALYDAVVQRLRQFPRHLVSPQAAQIADCTARDGLVFHRGRLWVPEEESLRTQITQTLHDSPIHGHPGREGTIAILRRQFFWPGLAETAKRFVRNCDTCGKVKVWRQKQQGLLQPLPIAETKWASISIDFMTHLPKTARGNENLMVVTCRFSGDVISIPLPNIETETVVQAFLIHVYAHHGPPYWIVSDRGSQWIDGFWRRFCECLQIERKLSTAHHPETDGGTERMNQEMLAFFRCYIAVNQEDWDKWTPAAMLGLNSRPQATRGNLSPFFLSHARDVHAIPQVEVKAVESSKYGAAERLVQRLEDARQWALSAVSAAQQTMEDTANRERKAPEQYRAGDKVWLNLKNIPRGRPSAKLDWVHGKYTILEQVAPMVYKLDVPGRLHPHFHTELLRRAHEDPLPSQRVVGASEPMIIDDEEEWEVSEILCATGEGERRVAWCKWKGWDTPYATLLPFVEDTRALDDYEAQYGDIRQKDGPRDNYLTKTGRLKAKWKRFNNPETRPQPVLTEEEEGDVVTGLPPLAAHTGLSHVDCDMMEVEEEDDG